MAGNLTNKKMMRYPYLVGLISFLILQYVFIGQMFRFAANVSPLVFELFAAVMGSIITVVAMALVMRSQMKQETEKEYASIIFDKKLQIYQTLLTHLFSIDDDRLLDESEIHTVENHIGLACLVANRTLVSLMAQFMYQQKVYGVLYYRSLNEQQLADFREFVESEKKQDVSISKLADPKYSLKLPVLGNEKSYFVSLDEFIQGIREDLAIVEGDVRNDIEHFVRTPINPKNLIPTPNLIND